MSCNYKPNPKRPGRCGAETEGGAKMCPTHQAKQREYMRQYRARKKQEEKTKARRDTVEAIGSLIDQLVAAEVKAAQSAGVDGFSLPDEDPGPEGARKIIDEVNEWLERFSYA